MQNILIILGSAPCVGSDIASAALLLPTPCPSVIPAEAGIQAFDFMLIGLDAVDKYTGRAKYFATYHPAEINASIERRAKAGGNIDFIIVSHQQANGLVKIIIPLHGVPSGSSALLGVHAGIQEGYKKIIVCGCPLTGKNDKGNGYEIFRAGWTAKLSEIKDKTRSMSGWTQELLGAPTEEWLNS